MHYLLGAAAVSAEQLSSIETALTAAVGTVMDTFIGLLPIIALIVGATFAIRFVSGKFNRVGRGK